MRPVDVRPVGVRPVDVTPVDVRPEDTVLDSLAKDWGWIVFLLVQANQSEGGYSLAKHPERVGTGPKEKNDLRTS